MGYNYFKSGMSQELRDRYATNARTRYDALTPEEQIRINAGHSYETRVGEMFANEEMGKDMKDSTSDLYLDWMNAIHKRQGNIKEITRDDKGMFWMTDLNGNKHLKTSGSQYMLDGKYVDKPKFGKYNGEWSYDPSFKGRTASQILMEGYDDNMLYNIGYDATNGGQKRDAWDEKWEGNLTRDEVILMGRRIAQQKEGLSGSWASRSNPIDQYESNKANGTVYSGSGYNPMGGQNLTIYTAYQKLLNGGYDSSSSSNTSTDAEKVSSGYTTPNVDADADYTQSMQQFDQNMVGFGQGFPTFPKSKKFSPNAHNHVGKLTQ